jgi:hypothetical protein
VRFCLLYLVDFFDPPDLLDVVLTTTDWDLVDDACAANTLESAAVIDVCRSFSIVHSFSVRMFVFRLLYQATPRSCSIPGTQVPLLAGYANTAVQSVCRVTENNFSSLAAFAAISISGSRLRLDNSPSSTDSVVEYCSLYTQCRACPECPSHQSTSIPDPQPGDSAHSRSTPPAGVIPLPRFRNIFSFRYIGTFPPSVKNRHYIISFDVHVHLPLALGPISCTNELFDFNFKIRRYILLVSNIALHTMN